MSILHVDLNSFYASCAVADSGGKYTPETPLIVRAVSTFSITV